MDIYRQEILDHYKHPHNFGHLPHPDHSVTLFNSACGDKITLELAFDPSKTRVSDVRFSGEGCAISQASASLLTDSVKGKQIAEVLKLSLDDVTALLATPLTPSRVSCALLPLEAIQKCILEWKKA